MYAAGVVSTAGLIALPTTMFLFVYLTCTVSAARVLTGAPRLAAVPALLVVATMVIFCPRRPDPS